jgi:hypothetical protein
MSGILHYLFHENRLDILEFGADENWGHAYQMQVILFYAVAFGLLIFEIAIHDRHCHVKSLWSTDFENSENLKHPVDHACSVFFFDFMPF